MLYIRVTSPFAAPHDSAIVLLGDLADLGTFACAFLLLIADGEHDEFRERVGITMIVMELIALLAFVLERLSRLWRACSRILLPAMAAKLGIKQQPGEVWRNRFVGVVRLAMLNSPMLLARIYCDRWMLRTLGRGLAARPLGRKEQPFRKLMLKSTIRTARRTTSGLSSLLPARLPSHGTNNSIPNMASESSGSHSKVALIPAIEESSKRSNAGNKGHHNRSGSMLDVWTSISSNRWEGQDESAAPTVEDNSNSDRTNTTTTKSDKQTNTSNTNTKAGSSTGHVASEQVDASGDSKSSDRSDASHGSALSFSTLLNPHKSEGNPPSKKPPNADEDIMSSAPAMPVRPRYRIVHR